MNPQIFEFAMAHPVATVFICWLTVGLAAQLVRAITRSEGK